MTETTAGSGAYTASVPNGTYDIYLGDQDTGKNVTVSSSIPDASVEVNYTGAAVTLAQPASLVYNGAAKTYTVGIVSTATLTAGNDYTLTYTGRNTTVYNSTTAPKNVGDYTVTFALTDQGQGKYSVTGTLTANFTITPAALTVTPASGQYKLFGTDDPASFSYTYSGNVGAETPTFSGALSRAPGGAVGNYAINLGNLTFTGGTNGFLDSNYTLGLPADTVNFEVKAYTPTETERATLSSPNGDNGWFKDVATGITLTAPDGFLISATGTLTTDDWAGSITVDKTNGSNKTASYYLKRISDHAISTELSDSYKVDTAVPIVHVDVNGTTDAWTQKPVVFTLSDTAGNACPVSYQVRIGSGSWEAVSGNTVTVTGNVNTTYQFRAVSGSGVTSSASENYTVKLASDAYGETVRDIDSLPDPCSASDQDNKDNAQAIKDAKILYDSLSKDEQVAVGQSRISKLNSLISRLDTLLVIVPKDEDTGITAGNLGTSVLVPELNELSVGKVMVQLVVDPVTDNDTQHANFALAATTLDGSGMSLVAAYDVSLFKTVFDSDGRQTSYGKINNSAITGPVTIRIPVPAEYLNTEGLQVAYISAGTVTMLPTETVTVNGVKYLQFTTTHFSVYAIVAPQAVSNPKTGSPDGGKPLGYLWPLGISGAALAGGLVYRRRRRMARQK